MEEEKLYKGIRIKVWNIANDSCSAGGYSITRVDMFSEQLIKELSAGEPFSHAWQDAEELAILIDAELTLNGIMIRKSITGDYK
jgi:hypothetical protein